MAENLDIALRIHIYTKRNPYIHVYKYTKEIKIVMIFHKDYKQLSSSVRNISACLLGEEVSETVQATTLD